MWDARRKLSCRKSPTKLLEHFETRSLSLHRFQILSQSKQGVMSTPGYRTGWVFRFKSFRCWHHLLGFFWLIRAVSSHPLAILRGGGGELFLILYSSSSLASVGFSPPSYNRWASPSFLRCCCCIFPSKITFLSLSLPTLFVCVRCHKSRVAGKHNGILSGAGVQ